MGRPDIRLIVPAVMTCAAAWFLYTILWDTAPFSASDTGLYLGVGRDLLDGGLSQLHDRTIGYPLILVLTGSVDQPGRLLFHLQFFLHAASVGALFWWLAQARINRAGNILFLVLAFLPPYVEPAAYVLTETISQFCLVLAFVTLMITLSTKNLLAPLVAGFAIGFAALSRPTFQLLAPALALFLVALVWVSNLVISKGGNSPETIHEKPVSRRVGFHQILALLFFPVLIVGGLVTFNAIRFSYPGMTPMLGFNLSSRTALFVEDLPPEDESFRSILMKYRDKELVNSPSHSGTRYIWKAQQELASTTKLDRVGLSNLLVKINMRLILEAPLSYLRSVLHAFADFNLPSAGRLSIFESNWLHLLWAILHFAVMLAAIVVSYPVVWLLCKRMAEGGIWDPRSQETLGFLLIAVMYVYTAAVSCALEAGEPRYRSPLDLLILTAVFAGFSGVSRAFRKSIIKHQETGGARSVVAENP